MSDKLLLLHPKGMDPDALQKYKNYVASLLTAEVVLAVEDFATHFTGSWREWASEITERYDGFIVLTNRIGRATADIIRAALDLRLTVALAVRDDGDQIIDVIEVAELVEIDKKDWRTGWEVR
jgi:hypothetical protein